MPKPKSQLKLKRKPPSNLASRFRGVGIKRLTVFDPECEGSNPTGFYHTGLKSLLLMKKFRKDS